MVVDPEKRQACIEWLHRYSDEDHPEHVSTLKEGDLRGCIMSIAEGVAILLEESRPKGPK